jgi:hypothetical protein
VSIKEIINRYLHIMDLCTKLCLPFVMIFLLMPVNSFEF